LKGIVTCDLGPSFKYEGRTVGEIIFEGFPVSCCLGLEAIFLAFSGGVLLGSIAAAKRGKYPDQLAMLIAVIGISVPNFILASFLQYIFAMKLNLLPVARWGSFAQTILPAIALAAIPMAFVARLTRTNMVEVLEQDYILTARSKGLSMFQVIRRHVFRNSILPVITYLGPLSANVLTGSFVIEKIFGIPGLGNWFVLSITNRDYTVIIGITIFYSALLLIAVFIVDILSAILDTRIQYRDKTA
ncbi:MAG TPA: ABC transporter permease, partial [Chlamydiales bacterium]|nr:ABC transporter permease [Chlamydiales bacterium]